MKRTLSLALLAILFLAAVQGLAGQVLIDNSYYRKSIELQKKAQVAFDEGEYDQAVALASQAKEYSILSNEYVELMLLMNKADKALAAARRSLALAERSQVPRMAPENLAAAQALLAQAEEAYGRDAFPEATDQARKALQASDAALTASRLAAEKALAAARAAVDKAYKAGAILLSPSLYGAARNNLTAAEKAYVIRALADAHDGAVKAGQAAEASLAAAQRQADEALKEARSRLARAKTSGALILVPDRYNAAESLLAGAEKFYSDSSYAYALAEAEKTQKSADEALAAAKALTDEVFAQAREAFGTALGKSHNVAWPVEYNRAMDEMRAAEAAYGKEIYAEAKIRAEAALAILRGLPDAAPPPPKPEPAVASQPVYPAKYTVRLIPERRDCLWRIAELGFVYNNPLQWPVLYEANKKTFKDPSNPHLIYPGQIIVIPSIMGEQREGMWDSRKEYPTLPKKAK